MKIPSSSISSTSATAGLNACGGGSSTGDSAFASSMTTFVDPLDFEGILMECHGIPILGSLIECSGRSFNQFYVTYILLLKKLSIHKPCNISISRLKHRFEMTENICNEYAQMQNKKFRFYLPSTLFERWAAFELSSNPHQIQLHQFFPTPWGLKRDTIFLQLGSGPPSLVELRLPDNKKMEFMDSKC